MDQTAKNLAKRLSREILAEVLKVPEMSQIDNFSELHDHCDANCLAGVCEPGHYIHGLEYEHEILTEAQNRVDKALRTLNA